ncbi:MAG TPA: hypothetical protein VGD54_19280, partial [Steroidobacteraceae bacterium]
RTKRSAAKRGYGNRAVRAWLPIYMSGIFLIASGRASAEPWSIEPRLGASAEYGTNPGLRIINPVSEEHVAALFSLPLRYDADGIQLFLSPSGRISNSRGYSSLASNYLHVNGNAQFTNDVGSTSVQGELARDSSLYYAGALASGIGVRRDTALTSADWTRSLTERSLLQLDASWTHVSYAQSANAFGLTDYRYLSAGPTFGYALTERDTLKVLSSFGLYQSLNGISESKSENLQLGFVRQLNELWSLSTIAGYSRSTNTQKYFFGPFFLGNFSSNQNGAVYAATLTRQNEQFSFSGGVSRSLQPTGFAYLSRQDSFTLNAAYALTERWDFGLSAAWQKVQNPVLGAPAGSGTRTNDARFLNVQLTANWHWTPQWIISMHVMRITQQFSPPPVSVASSGVSLDIVRQFLRFDL